MKKDQFFNNEHSSSGLKKKAIRGAGATIFAHGSNYFIQMVATIILARILSPDDFGLMAMVTTISILLMNFGTRGFTEATVQDQDLGHEKVSTLFWLHLLISIGLMALFIGAAPIISWFYDEPRLTLIAVGMSLTFIFYALSTQHQALLMRNMEFFKITEIQIGAALISSAAAIILALSGAGYWSLVTRRVSIPLAIAIGSWMLCKWRPGRPRKNTGVASMVSFGMNTYGNFTLNYLSRNLDKILIGWRHGAQSLGYYDRAYYFFVMPVTQLSHPLTNVAVATLSRLRNDNKQFCSYFLKALSILSFTGMLISVILTVNGRDLIYVLLGPQWGQTGLIFTVFGPGIGIIILYGTHGWLHLALGRADRWLRWGAFELVVSFLAFLIGLPFGGVGVAAAYTISFFLLILPGLVYAGSPAGLSAAQIVSIIWRHAVSALGTGVFAWYVLYSGWGVSENFAVLNVFFRIIISSAFCCAAYLMLTVVLYGGVGPIRELLSVLKEMLPGKSVRKNAGGDNP